MEDVNIAILPRLTASMSILWRTSTLRCFSRVWSRGPYSSRGDSWSVNAHSGDDSVCWKLACSGLLFHAHVLGVWLVMSHPTRSARWTTPARWTTWRSTFRRQTCITLCQEFRGADRHDPADSCNTNEHAVIAAPAPEMFAKQSEEDSCMVVLLIRCIRWRQNMLGP